MHDQTVTLTEAILSVQFHLFFINHIPRFFAAVTVELGQN